MQEKAEYERTIKSIEYRYWVDSHIFITCILSLEPISSTKEDGGIVNEADKAKQNTLNKQTTDTSADKAKKSERINSDKIYVSYDIFAPTENLRSINREKELY